MLPSRCYRCGAVSREALCPSCIDYLVAYRPLWLDPSLLPGPSLMDLLGPRETALVAADGSRMEWRSSPREATPADAVRLIALLGLPSDPRPVVSTGDAEILHEFLGRGRRSSPSDPAEREALALLYRFLAARDWMPAHLAADYRLRARSLNPAGEAEPPMAVARLEELAEEELPPEPPAPEPSSTEPPAEAPALPTIEEPEEPEPLPIPPPGPEPSPEPEPPLPLPEPEPGPQPEPEPEPEPEEALPSQAVPDALARVKEEMDRERQSVEAWVQSRTEAMEAKERVLLDRERSLEAKAQQVEEHVRSLEARLLAFEKDEARREVLRFLAAVPGMTEDEANVIATAFPDLASLRDADAKALTQCRGVTDTLARAVRLELVPGEVEDEQRATDLREEAQAFLEEGDYRASLECYERLLRERPEDTSLWFEKAELLILLDRPEDALQCYQRVIDLDRKNRQAWFERANLLFGKGRLADAVDALREALKIDPSKSGDIALKAEQLRRDGHGNEAAILYQAILDVEPDNPRALLGLGDTLLSLGDLEAAEGLLTRALGKAAQNPQILFRKGELLRRKGRWGAAVQFYNRSIALDWGYADPWMAKGEILLEHDRAQEALECFDRVTAIRPNDAPAWARKAMAHRAIHQAKEARAAYEKAVRLDPEDPAVLAAGTALSEPILRPAALEPKATPEEGPPEEESMEAALEELEEEAAEASEPPSEEPSLARALEGLVEESAEAEPPAPEVPADFKSFVESVEAEKEDTHVLLQLAELALEGGDAEMALLRYEQAAERDPRSADAWTGKGTALQQLERYEEALRAYDQALEINPDHEMAKRWRETCLRHVRRRPAG